MKRFFIALRAAIGLVALAAAAFAPIAFAQNGGIDEVLVENSYANVTRGDYEAELQRLPPDMRAGFGNSGKRVFDLLSRLLLTKSLAAEARKNGLDKDPAIQRRMALEIDRLQAGLEVAKIEEDAGKAFDFRRPQLESRARELYLANRDKYRVPEQVSVSHILFDTKKHTPEEALKLAQEARAKIVAGADFSALAKEVSEDPTSLRNSGRLDYFDKGQMDPAFSDAAFALQNVGDVSEPVRSSFGYHIIRLEGRHPASVRTFEQVKHSILAEERVKYIEAQRDIALAPMKSDPATKVNQPAIDSLIVKADSEPVEKPEAGQKAK